MNTQLGLKPTPLFVMAAWVVMAIGVVSYMLGLLNAPMEFNEKGYYFAVIMYSLYAAISVQKSVRDRAEGLPVNQSYYLLSIVSVFISVSLLVIGLFNADLLLSEKGFFGIAYLMSLFASITVQKNVRDNELFNQQQGVEEVVDHQVGEDERL
jgi:uncharacterized membrane protein YiaA